MRHEVVLRVNGEDRTTAVAAGEVLLDVLRDRLGVRSPKIGCERGDCGSCTVLLDEQSVRACLVLAVEADGRTVTTVEGMAGLERLEEELVARSSFQCGFCAPGIVLGAAELLRHNPAPTREQVQEAISGNLCRCTGYEPIIQAILAAAGESA